MIIRGIEWIAQQLDVCCLQCLESLEKVRKVTFSEFEQTHRLQVCIS